MQKNGPDMMAISGDWYGLECRNIADDDRHGARGRGKRQTQLTKIKSVVPRNKTQFCICKRIVSVSPTIKLIFKFKCSGTISIRKLLPKLAEERELCSTTVQALQVLQRLRWSKNEVAHHPKLLQYAHCASSTLLKWWL